jgi:hypothetical protein
MSSQNGNGKKNLKRNIMNGTKSTNIANKTHSFSFVTFKLIRAIRVMHVGTPAWPGLG